MIVWYLMIEVLNVFVFYFRFSRTCKRPAIWIKSAVRYTTSRSLLCFECRQHITISSCWPWGRLLPSSLVQIIRNLYADESSDIPVLDFWTWGFCHQWKPSQWSHRTSLSSYVTNMFVLWSQMQGLTWGQWSEKSFALRQPAQIVLGADVLYASKGAEFFSSVLMFLRSAVCISWATSSVQVQA